MRLSHDPKRTRAVFDDPNLVSRAGLVPVMALAGQADLAGLTRRLVRIDAATGANPDLKVGCLVAGMAAGADSIDDMDVLRHGAMGMLFAGVRAPSTLGSFLRSFTWGNVRQLGKVHREVLTSLAGRVPLLPGADVLAFAGIDSTQKRVYGYKKQGAAFGHTKIAGKTVLVRGLNALAATIGVPRSGRAAAVPHPRGARRAWPRGRWPRRGPPVRRHHRGPRRLRLLLARVHRRVPAGRGVFSVTARMDPAVRPAIAGISEDARTPIRYPRAIWDDQLNAWISDAQVAEITCTAFASKKGRATTARLIVRRVRDLSPRAAAEGQDELFPIWRYHAVFTDSPFAMLQAEEQHRDHAIVEQVFAGWSDGPLAHLPSVISSHPPPVLDVHDATAIRRVARGGRGYLAPSITQMTGGFGARAACGDAVGCGVMDGSGR